MPTDPRITGYEFDAEVELAAQDKLASIGVRDADDLGPGRADVGDIARILNQPDPGSLPDEMEHAARLKNWVDQSQAPEQPFQSPLRQPSTQPQEPQVAEPVDNL